MRNAYIAMLMFLLLNASPAFSASKATCPERTLDTITLNGTYLGYFEGEETNSVGIRVDKDDIYVVCSEEEANTFFGNSKGKQISLTYELQQFFLGEGSDGECMRIEVCKNGKIVSSAQMAASQSLKSMFTSLKRDELVFHPCTGEGTTMEQMCWEGGKEGGISTTTAVNHIVFCKNGTGSEDGYKAGASPITWSEKDGIIRISSDGSVSTVQLQKGMYLIGGEPMLLMEPQDSSPATKLIGPKINGIQLGMNGNEAKAILSSLSDNPLVNDNDRQFDGTIFNGTGGRIRILTDNSLEFIALTDRALTKLFGSKQLDENFLQQFINKYGIPGLESTFVKNYSEMMLYHYTYTNQTENWKIVFGVYKTNGILHVASMTLSLGESYSFK